MNTRNPISGPCKCYLIGKKDIHQCDWIKSSDEDIVPGHPGYHKQIADVPVSAASIWLGTCLKYGFLGSIQICRIRNSRGGGRNLFVNTPSGGFWYKLDLRTINWFQGLLALTYLWYSQVLLLFVLLTCLWPKWALRTYCLDDFSSVLIGLSTLHLTPTDAFLIQGSECIKYIWPCYFPDWNVVVSLYFHQEAEELFIIQRPMPYPSEQGRSRSLRQFLQMGCKPSRMCPSSPGAVSLPRILPVPWAGGMLSGFCVSVIQAIVRKHSKWVKKEGIITIVLVVLSKSALSLIHFCVLYQFLIEVC